MSLKGKLSRMKKHMNLAPDSKEKNETIPDQNENKEVEVPYLDKWKTLGAYPFFFDGDYAIIKEKTYPISYQHGRNRFEELEDIVRQWNAFSLDHPLSSKDLRPEDLLFFDTETTGLGGGVGNTIFLLGYSQYTEEGVRLKQYFLPGPGAEVPFYQKFLRDVKELKNLVTYNGKAFDWPQVKTRHTLIRDRLPELPAFGHYDLLHGARRMWKNRLESVKLSLVEQEILQFVREEDTPGYLAPMLYFEYIKDQDPELISDVLLHNEKDILSLITLYVHLSKILLQMKDTVVNTEEQYEVARWYETIGHADHAAVIYEGLLKSSYGFKAKEKLSYLYKKKKQWKNAELLWKELSESSRKPEFDVELSKLYEHTLKDFEQAFYYAEKAYQKWKETNRILKNKEEQERMEFEKRLLRIEKKL
ncbi:ribonuclease H-like domain-containing protein [Pseudalkalibacillus caeni]|uniref:Exonuclease n=1 Tax=Exobacillus caeni TaxID=2574798 RepID=A0A5R9EYD0_9BACL|nr:ribonuclease H-like domain-containing protein [Pseudalkalibacillus caeni]TLS35206.1 exonuclease [Pseudalkalibacillus caeni]